MKCLYAENSGCRVTADAVLVSIAVECLDARVGFILIVEDDAGVREGMALLLEGEGYRVEAVGNGADALALMQARLPSVVLLDLMMPVMTGWALFDAMRADARLCAVPVCVVSAVASQAPSGVTAVLEKPVQVPTLLAFLARHF